MFNPLNVNQITLNFIETIKAIMKYKRLGNRVNLLLFYKTILPNLDKERKREKYPEVLVVG